MNKKMKVLYYMLMGILSFLFATLYAGIGSISFVLIFLFVSYWAIKWGCEELKELKKGNKHG